MPIKGLKLLAIFLLVLPSFGYLSHAASAKVSVSTPFDHQYTDLTNQLKKIIVAKGPHAKVNYRKLVRDSALLNKFLKTASATPPKTYESFTDQQKIAFLINAYNAFTLKLIADHYPLKSIKKMDGATPSPWKMKFFRLLGRDHNLDDLEHEMLRKQFNEKRVHFAVTCAANGCAPLRDEAYIADKLEQQLDDQTRLFLRDGTRNIIDIPNKKLKISKIFSWYEEDFKKDGGSVQKFIAPYITDDAMVKKDFENNAYDISYTDYDWDLNEAKE